MFRLLATPEMVESDHAVESGSSNPFGQIGLTSVDVEVEPNDVSTSCKVDVVAFIRCEEVSIFFVQHMFPILCQLYARRPWSNIGIP